jgi:hypothetical protein
MADEVKSAPTTGSASAKTDEAGANGGKAALSGDAKTATASITAPPVTEKPKAGGGVPLKDTYGNDLGVTVDTSGKAGQDADVAEVARTVTGWSTLVVDGEPFEYSEKNALALLQRFPHFVDQLRG